jgi:hypothetical protein
MEASPLPSTAAGPETANSVPNSSWRHPPLSGIDIFLVRPSAPNSSTSTSSSLSPSPRPSNQAGA